MLSTPQIVAELGWARKAIKSVLGITPTIMRPPFGDIGQSFVFYIYISFFPLLSPVCFIILTAKFR